MGCVAVSSASAATSNTPPQIWGQPATFATRDQLYTFRPGAADRDGERLRFSIVNKPKWMWFDAGTGQLRGIPHWAQRGRTFPGIVIRVSDSRATTALPAFAITVSQKPGQAGNAAPVIYGKPALRAQVGRPYAFKPAASDSDADALVFSIAGKPRWAKFDAATGTLFGTPAATDVGRYAGIAITVSDGKASAALAPFTMDVADAATRSVTLNWSVPTLNTDGSKLTDLAGYRVFYGTASRQYSNSVRVYGAASTSAVLDGLASGTWYFAIRSINQAGVASDYSGEVKAAL